MNEILSAREATDDHPPAASRASRIARVVVAASTSASDVRSIDGLLKAARSTIGVSHSTFCRWCTAEGLQAGNVVDLTRLLRAVRMSRRHNCQIAVVLEVDGRTLPGLLRRGGLSEQLDQASLSPGELCARQRLVSNRFVLDEVLRLLETAAEAQR